MNTPNYFAFDKILDTHLPDIRLAGADSTGQWVIASNDNGVFLEECGEDLVSPPIQMFAESADSVGFFGRDIDLIAVAIGSELSIIRFYQTEVVAKFAIRPGSVFISDNANSQRIGAISPQGVVFTVEESTLKGVPTSLKVGEGYNVLWSANAYPVGYTWADERAHIFVKASQPGEPGAVLHSAEPLKVLGMWTNTQHKRHEVYYVSATTPHILRRMFSHHGAVVTDEVASFDRGSVVDHVISLPSSGKPVVVTAYNKALMQTKTLVENTALTDVMNTITTNKRVRVTPTITGSSSYISYSQTPVTQPVTAITNLFVADHPTHEISSLMPKPAPTLPRVNKVY